MPPRAKTLRGQKPRPSPLTFLSHVVRAVPKLLQFSQKVAPIFQKSCSKVAPKF